MARERESPIVEQVREEAHDAGLLDQRYKEMLEGHVGQSERNIEKSLERLRSIPPGKQS
jgi:hypothetical protein